MSSASPKVVAYLTRQLSRNPISESADIVTLRAKALRLAKTKQHANEPSIPAEQRQQLRDQLDTIRQQCFSAPVEQLQGQLNQMELANYPDLAALAKRLKVILDSRTKLPALSSDKRFDGDFFSCLKTVLVSPSRDVTILREQVLASFRHRRNRKRGQAMIRMLREELPELYALEADWLSSLAKCKVDLSSITLSNNSENSGQVAIAFFLIVLVVGGIIIAAISVDDKPNYIPVKAKQQQRIESLERTGSKLLDNAMEQHRREQQERMDSIRRDSQRRMEEMKRDNQRRMEEMQESFSVDSPGSSLPQSFPSKPDSFSESFLNDENPFDVPSLPSQP